MAHMFPLWMSYCGAVDQIHHSDEQNWTASGVNPSKYSIVLAYFNVFDSNKY